MSVLQKIEKLESRVCGLETPLAARKATEAAQKPAEDDDDGVDLFASDSEEESAEAAKVREERLAAYNAKKSKSKSEDETVVVIVIFCFLFRTCAYCKI